MLLVQIILLIGLFSILMFFIKFGFDKYSLTYEKSDIDDAYHLVRNMDDKDEAADLMADIKARIKRLLVHLKNKYKNNPNIMRLIENFNVENLKETDVGESGTSYSINKGSELSLCLRDKTDSDYDLHNVNIIMFVTLHELSHLMSKSYGHNEEFGDNFVFILKEAIEIGIYSSENYDIANKDYCGIKVTSNPLF